MTAELVQFFSDQQLDKLRVYWPSRFVFLCGGEIAKSTVSKPLNLRDYLYRVRPFRKAYEFILAESANQLYRDTSYYDLISFEEDIAKISAIVLVISESAGSLAELGAFSSNVGIQPSLRILIAEDYAQEESFIRFGPVERIIKRRRGDVGIYPWKRHKSGSLNISSIAPHYTSIKHFIDGEVSRSPKSVAFNNLGDRKAFFIIYWLINLSVAISPRRLYDLVNTILPICKLSLMSDDQIRDKIYCMTIAKWISKKHYSGSDYYYSLFENDPFKYSFKENTSSTTRDARKLEVTRSLKKCEKLPKHVARLAADSRKLRP